MRALRVGGITAPRAWTGRPLGRFARTDCDHNAGGKAKATMLIVFCCDALEPQSVDRSFGAEAEATDRLGILNVLVDHDVLMHGEEPGRAVRRVPEQPQPVLAAYRGWMPTPPRYRLLYEALATKNIRLINDPKQYQHGHYLPENYSVIKGYTPRSVWVTRDLSIDRIMEAVAIFGDAPLVIKDFVKSRKHEWAEACFIASASDRRAVERVVSRFLELQGDDLNEGLVFREYVEFESIGVHPKSEMPLTEEYRSFWLDGKPIFMSPYWEEGKYRSTTPTLEPFAEVAGDVRSRLFTMDLAKRRDGEWMIVELGDGQVSGLPMESDAGRFYKSLAAAWPEYY